VDTSRRAADEGTEGPTRTLTTAAFLRYRLQRRLASARRLPGKVTHNERVLYTEVIFQAISDSGALAFLSVFLVRLGAPSWLVGLFSSLPALVTMASAFPAGAFVQRQRSLVKTVNGSRLLFRSVVGAFALLPLLPVTIAPYIMVVAYSLAAIPSSVLNVSFTTLLGQAVPTARRPGLLSTRLAIHGMMATVVGFAAGQWLDWAPYPLNYQVLFGSAIAAGVGGVLVLSRFREAPTSAAALPPRTRVSLRQMWALLMGIPAFRKYATATLVFRLTMSMPTALYPIFRVRELGASDAWIGAMLTVERLLSVFAYFALARLLTKPRYRRWLWITCTGMAFYPFVTSLARTPEMLLLAALVGGLFSGGMNIFLTETLLQASPEDDRPTFIAANSFLVNVTAFVGPMLGTALAGFTGTTLALAIIGGLRFVSSLSFWRLGVGLEKESAPAEAVE
jgi:MFS family permease